MLTIKQMLIPIGQQNRPAHPLTPLYITIHETGNTSKGAGAINHATYLINSKEVTGWHYTVDDSNIVQHIPDTENAWHAGDGTNGTGNRQSIAIEICINPDSNFIDAVKNASELVYDLMTKYSIPLENVVQHNHWNGKDCPHKLRSGSPLTWFMFQTMIKALYPTPTKKFVVQLGYFSSRTNAENFAKWLGTKNIDTTVIEKEV